ncbi:alpha/beta hydrolase [Bradyrhizobium sp. RD5-C2]|uniref:alpha/beta hydrolase n=1 Tax=Bradyrhizobium sp. RD5-C2 TaxID=244562 RepID=UPI001CC7C898|nr:alpha/beta hydrolase [Bradyrhizobium sp. RD5-C2]GIQ76935.1 lipase [Bradyrhizobium sp. RD5-C2]
MAIDPELAPFIARLDEAWPEPPLSLPVSAWRDRVEQLSAAARTSYPAGLIVETLIIDAPRPVRVRIYRPASARPLPALIYMHGGGWVIGSIDSHDAITAAIAADTPCVVISVDYARAPEHPFPAAIEDCAAAVRWTFGNAARFGIDPRAICVGGDSAGGNLAAAMTLAFRESDHALCGQLLIYPCVDVDFDRPSYLSEAEAPYLKAREMIWFWNQYCRDVLQRQNPLAVPMRARSHSDLPPAFIVVAEHDPLRDDGHAYAERLKAAGVQVTFRPGRGLIHGFVRARGLCAAAQAEHLAMTAWLRGFANTGA